MLTRGKIVRRVEENIFGNPKYDRLLQKKQDMPRFGRRGRRPSEYSVQLTEKQKLKFTYGLRERQFHNLFEKAKRMDGVTGHNFLILLERRLDNVVYQSGMATTRVQARQFVSHGHFHLNGKRVDVPSITVKPGDVITTGEKRGTAEMVRKLLSQTSAREMPAWVEVSPDELKISVVGLPTREQIKTNVEEQLIVEYYSR